MNNKIIKNILKEELSFKEEKFLKTYFQSFNFIKKIKTRTYGYKNLYNFLSNSDIPKWIK